MKTHITADAAGLYWRYEPVPTRAKCLLLNPGGCLIVGPPRGEYGVEYIAWCPMPKRDRAAERVISFLSKDQAVPAVA